jgi:ferrous iron transport protein A
MDAFNAGVGSFPLILAGEAERVRIVAIAGGEGLYRKLTDLGLVPGSEITIVSRVPGGPMVVARDDLRVALGTGMAHRVMVARVDPECGCQDASGGGTVFRERGR